jgi:hypothetical protein
VALSTIAATTEYYGAKRDDRALEQLRQAGVDCCLFVLPSTPAERNLPSIQQSGGLAARHR